MIFLSTVMNPTLGMRQRKPRGKNLTDRNSGAEAVQLSNGRWQIRGMWLESKPQEALEGPRSFAVPWLNARSGKHLPIKGVILQGETWMLRYQRKESR